LFRIENEEIVKQLLEQNHTLELVMQQLMTGYHQKSDTMFAALLRRKH